MKFKKKSHKKKHGKIEMQHKPFDPVVRTFAGKMHKKKKKKKLRGGEEKDPDSGNFFHSVASNVGGYLGGHVGAHLGIAEIGSHFGRRVGKSAAKTFDYWLRSSKKKK